MAYTLKTDRELQWLKFKNQTSMTRKKLKVLRDYFDTGALTEDIEFSDRQLLFLQPHQTVEAWQYVISDVYQLHLENWKTTANQTDEVALCSFYHSLQQNFQASNCYYFNPEDVAWFFKQIFGETYDPNRFFPLKLPNESEYRKITLTANEIINPLMSDCYFYFEPDEDDSSFDRSSFIFLLDYISSLLPFISKEAFVLEEPNFKTCKTLMVFYALNYIIHFAQKSLDSASEEDKPKIELARKVKAIFDNYEGDLGEYQQLVELVEQEGPQV